MQVLSKNLKIRGNVIISWYYTKSETFIYSSFITRGVNYFKTFLLFQFRWSKIQYLQILEYHDILMFLDTPVDQEI